MSTASRLISGSAASWVRIGITLVSQLALVPIYLNFWHVEVYGVWLAIQALVAIMTMIDMGHQTYLAYEFLRFGKSDSKELSKYLWSGVVIGMAIGILQILFILVIINTDTFPLLLGDSGSQQSSVIEEAGMVLLMQGGVWLVNASMGGLLVRALEAYGYFPRMAWWGVFVTFMQNIAPAIAVTLGAGLLTAGVVIAAASVVFNIPVFLDMFYLMRKEGIKFSKPSLKLGFKNFLRSVAIAGKLLLENARQQGVRIVLAPLSGAAGLAAFSTMRTGSNVALQGLNTITNPLMPDLMRFLHAREQLLTEAAFGTVWIVLVALMAPAVVILQAFIEPLFFIWTQGQIPFDPVLFALLSLSVLIYAVVQPAMAVVLGNNLIRQQLILSVLAAVTVIGGMIVLVPMIGIVGAGVALLVGELVASAGYRSFAIQWLHQNSIIWPNRIFLRAVASVAIAALSMFGMIYFPSMKWGIFSVSMVLFLANFWRFWNVLPIVLTQRAIHILRNLPILNKMFTDSSK
jgi:O-antigen/teichoic acid export membrane protein